MTKVTIDRELLERLATECDAETEWNCANVPAGTRAATTRAIAMKSVADELRAILAAPRQLTRNPAHRRAGTTPPRGHQLPYRTA